MPSRVFRVTVAAALVLTAAALAGCATAKSDGTGAVLSFEPRSGKEARAVEWLQNSDEEARRQIEEDEAAFVAARRTYANAFGLEQATDLPADAVRPSADEVKRLLAEAVRLNRRLRDGVAMHRERYEFVLRAYPDNWYVRHRYADFLAETGLLEEAGAEWEKVIVMEPRFPYALNSLGTVYNEMGRSAEAIQLFNRAVALKGDEPTFHVNLAVNYAIYRKEAKQLYGWEQPRTFRECINAWRRARDLAPQDPEIAWELATQYVMAKHFGVSGTADEALDAWWYYLCLDLPRDKRGYACRNVGLIYLKEKDDPLRARLWLAKAIVLVPGDGTTASLLKEAQDAAAGLQN